MRIIMNLFKFLPDIKIIYYKLNFINFIINK